MPAPTDEAVVLEFRAHYLYSGNAAKSARAVGIPERTGRDLAQKISEEVAFAAERRSLRAQYLDELVCMRMKVAKVALKRFRAELPPDGIGPNGESIPVIDKRGDYGRLVLDAEKNAQQLAKVESPSETDGSGPVEITIRRIGKVDAD
jgi:hypothetical protein